LINPELGFTITPKRSRRTPTVALTDLDFADDVCLLSNEMDQAQHLLAQGTFLDTLKKDAGLENIEKLRMYMEDRGDWMICTSARLRPP